MEWRENQPKGWDHFKTCKGLYPTTNLCMFLCHDERYEQKCSPEIFPNRVPNLLATV